MKIKKNDNVVVIAGKDKGTRGTVTRALPAVGKVVISDVNTKKKHKRSRQKNEKGDMYEIDMPVDVSNVALIDPDSGKPTRVGVQVTDEGKKVRISKKSGKEV